MELFIVALKDLIKEIHIKAENCKWAQLLVSGSMTEDQYAYYLYQQSFVYAGIENRAAALELINSEDIRNIKRVIPIASDLSLYQKNFPRGMLPSVERYIKYCEMLDEKGCWAHIYVRHFGDMYGGNIIKKHLPLSTMEGLNPQHTKPSALYEFDNKKELISLVRANLTDDMADEAHTCFEFAIDLFQELEAHFNL